jgi:hypothetical protein
MIRRLLEIAMNLKSTAFALGLASLALTPIAQVLPGASGFDAAFAEKGNNGKGHEKHENKGKKPKHAKHQQGKALGHAKQAATVAVVWDDLDEVLHQGDIASHLKGLNAIRANPNAMENAAPDSQVGRIVAYREAAEGSKLLNDRLAAASERLSTLSRPTYSVAQIDLAISKLDPADPRYQEKLVMLQDYRVKAATYEQASAEVTAARLALVESQRQEEDRLYTASNGAILSPAEIDYVRSVLGL